MVDKHIEKYIKMRQKKFDDKATPFDHFSSQAKYTKSQKQLAAKLEEELKGKPEDDKIKKLAELVAKSYLQVYSKEDLKSALSTFNSGIGLVPNEDLMYIYCAIPTERRFDYLDACVDLLSKEGIIDKTDASQVRCFKSRILNNIYAAEPYKDRNSKGAKA